MASLNKIVPSTKALLALEAAARHGNFTAAANELNISQVAVTYQIRKLEEAVGSPMFERLQRGVRLTRAGKRLSEAVRFGFSHVADAISDIQRVDASSTLTIAATNAVAFYWLRPVVMAFQQAFPEVDIRILAGDRDEFLAEDNVNVAIRHGTGDWSGMDARYLFDEVLRPVCSPLYLDRNGPFRDPSDLLGATLLQLEPFEPNWTTWRKWFRFQDLNIDESASIKVVGFNSYPVLIEAALAGVGVALGDLQLIETLQKERRLICLCDTEMRTGQSYFIVTPQAVPASESVQQLIAMMHKVAGNSPYSVES